MFRIRRGPRSRDMICRPLHHHWHGDHGASFRVLVLVMAFAWGRHPVANVDRYLAPQPHRTRVKNVCRVQRWDPDAALQQQAYEWRRALAPPPS